MIETIERAIDIKSERERERVQEQVRASERRLMTHIDEAESSQTPISLYFSFYKKRKKKNRRRRRIIVVGAAARAD